MSPSLTESVAPGQVVVLFVRSPLVVAALGAEDDDSQRATHSCTETEDRRVSQRADGGPKLNTLQARHRT